METEPTAKEVAEIVDRAFRKGDWASLERAKRENFRDFIQRGVVRSYVMIFLIDHFSSSEFSSIREEVDRLTEAFNKWRSKKLSSKLPWKRTERKIVKMITLSTLAVCADEEFEEFSRYLGQLPPGSGEYDYYAKMVSYWSKIQEITEAAAELE